MVVISRSGAHRAQVMVVDMNSCLMFAEKSSLDTIMGADGDQSGTMFHTTLDISLPRLYPSNGWRSTAVWVALWGSLSAMLAILMTFSL